MRDTEPPLSSSRTRIWDLPTRLAHGLLALLFVVSFVTGQAGGSWLEWHFLSGYALFALLVFRLLWGFAGPRYARFAAFAPSPSRTLAYLRARRREAGHSPLGAWSVYAMLAALGAQVATGLYANDATFTEGPWAKFVSNATSNALTRLHHLNRWMLLALVLLHLAALAVYAGRGARLLGSMWHGDAFVTAVPAEDDARIRLRAVLLAALATGFVRFLIAL